MEQSRRISRMFRASFGSCQTRKISDVMEKAVFAPLPQVQTGHRKRTSQFQIIDQTTSMSPKARPFPSICKPRCPESTEPINHSCIRVSKDVLRRRKVCVSGGDAGGRICPLGSPNSPLDDFHNFYSVPPKKKSKQRKKKTRTRGSRSSDPVKIESFPFGSASKDSYSVRNSWWLSSDEEEEEEETEALFSSRSLSSDPSESRGRRSEVGAKMRDSFAVVKKSSDPYSDFRTSMVEMIVEKQIFGTKDLENLLQCFLSLNSDRHHKIILEVFTEIWEALFSDWS